MSKIIKKIKKKTRKAIFRTDSLVSQTLSGSNYYSIVNKSFKREMNATLAGKKNHNKNYELIRNIHRIEKGLTMIPRKALFAEDYIFETVKYLKESQISNSQLDWAHGVLNSYFNSVSMSKEISRAKKEFLEISRAPNNYEKVPFHNSKNRDNSLTYESLLELASNRSSTRWFTDEEISKEEIDSALEIALQSPSACNRQPFRFEIFNNTDLASDITELAMGTRGFSQQVKNVAVVIGDLSAYSEERDRHAIYIDSSLASMAFIYGLESLGINSCCINWPDIEEREKEMEKQLQLKKYERVIMLIIFGKRDNEVKVPYSEKKTIEDIRRYNK